MSLSNEPEAYQWALPEGLEVPPDELQARLDFYHDAVILYLIEKGVITTKMISARDVALAMLSEVPLRSGLLPKNALWWGQGKDGIEVALWQPPKIWRVALETEPFKPPRRFRLPMPGLIFISSPGRAPKVYAAKKRPTKATEVIYHAPLFNVFRDGRTCPGSHKYPAKIEEIPGSFFASFFSPTGDYRGRSKKYPDDLLKLWEEIDGRKRYPLDDLVPFEKLEDIINSRVRAY
jgi:PRTRC genetic system protein B